MVEPILAEERVEAGLWTTQKYGDLAQGDKRLAMAFVTGRVCMKQLRGLSKLEFEDLAVVHRRVDGDGKRQEVKAKVYLTKKKAKRRMADLEETAYCVGIPKDVDKAGFVAASPGSLGTFEISLRDAPDDPRNYKGVVIAKPANEDPFTEEPAVYGYARFIDDRPEVPSTDAALGLTAYKDLVKKTTTVNVATSAVVSAMDAASRTIFSLKGNKERRASAETDMKDVRSKLKSITYYRRMARKAWDELDKVEEQAVTFDDFKRALDLVDVALIEPRAIRLFEACDLDKSGVISMAEFEVALMMHDAAPDAGVTPKDAFRTFDVDNSGTISRTAFPRVVDALCDDERGGGGRIDSLIAKKNKKRKKKGQAPTGGGKLDQVLRNVMQFFNEDYSSSSDDDDDDDEFSRSGDHRRRRMEALFDSVDVDGSGAIDYDEFRMAWTALIDVDSELKKRGVAAARAPAVLRPFAFARNAATTINKRTLLRLCKEEEQREQRAFQATKDRIEELRVEARQRRDVKRRERRAIREKRAHAAARDTALRNKERNAIRMKEQAARGRQRTEEKIMKNRLAAEEAATQRKNRAKLATQSKDKETDRIAAIRAAGLDYLTHAGTEDREMPKDIYAGSKARLRLADVVYADLGDNKFMELPERAFLTWFASLRFLRLTNNRLIKLPEDELVALGKLEVLKIDSNSLVALPETLSQLQELRELDASNNRLGEIESSLARPLPSKLSQKLRILNLASNRLATLPTGLCQHLMSLQDLRLRGNDLFELPVDLGDLVALTSLDVRSNKLHAVPESLGDLIHLKVLDLGLNQLTAFPATVKGLQNCEFFYLDKNHLGKIDAWIAGWRRAVFIDLSHNAIAAIDKALGGSLKRLNELRLGGNPMLDRLPPELGLCVNLAKLDASACAIRRVPVELGALAFVHTVILRNNHITGPLPEQIGLLCSVTSLDLSKNRIDQLPATVAGLKELISLNLSQNHLAEIPDTIGECYRLEELYLAANRLASFPLTVGRCAALQILDLTSNVVSDLPQDLSILTKIKRIYLGKNRLRALPIGMASVFQDSDVVIELDRNPFTDLPPRWSKFVGATAHERAMWPSGYDNESLKAWIIDHAVFYRAALEEWTATGPLHVSGRSNLATFEINVKKRIKDSGNQDQWHSYLLPLLRTYYFNARRTGNPPKFERLLDQDIRHRQRTQARADAIHSARAQKAKDDALDLAAMRHAAYFAELDQRRAYADDVHEHRNFRDTLVQQEHHMALLADVQRRALAQDLRADLLDQQRRQDDRDDLIALHNHLRETYGPPDDGIHYFPPLVHRPWGGRRPV